jgi:hypothetical protein
MTAQKKEGFSVGARHAMPERDAWHYGANNQFRFVFAYQILSPPPALVKRAADTVPFCLATLTSRHGFSRATQHQSKTRL